MIKTLPPKRMLQFLRWFCRKDYLEEIEGDLTEVFIKQSESSPRKAKWKFAWSVIKYFRPAFLKAFESHQPNAYGMFTSYFKIGWRNLLRNKTYSIINISGLSLGLASAMLIILYSKDEISFDRFHRDAESIYRIVIDVQTPDPSTSGKMGTSSIFDGPQYAAAIPEIESFARLKNDYLDIKVGDNLKSQSIFRADTNFLALFTFPFLKGNPETALLHPSSIVLSEDMAKSYFGTTDVLNKTLLLRQGDSFEPFIITGITQRCPQNSSIKFDLIIPLVGPASNDNGIWLQCDLHTFVKISDKAQAVSINSKMQKVFEEQAKEILTNIRSMFGASVVFQHQLQPLSEIHLSEDFSAKDGLADASKQSYSYILSGIAVFILLIACVNFINLMIAQSVRRAKEVGIRKVIGGQRSELMKQFLGESFLLCSMAFLLALLIAQLILPVFNDVVNKSLALSYLLDIKVVIGYFVLFLLTSLISGFYPAFVLSGYSPLQTLYKGLRLTSNNYFQRTLVTMQFTLATLMTLAAIIAYQQFDHLTTVDWGLNSKNVIAVYKNELKQGEYEFLREELLTDPSIQSVTHSGWGGMSSLKVNGETKTFSIEKIDETYLSLLSISILSGRNFSPDFPSDSSGAVLVNESFVKAAGWSDPAGTEFITSDGEKFRVIGVIGDYYNGPPIRKIEPYLLRFSSEKSYDRIYAKTKPGSEVASLKKIELAFKKAFPLVPFRYNFLEDQYLQGLANEARWKRVMFLGACLTIFISCIGMFGMALLLAEKRFKEIGIRKVLGASVRSIVGMLSKDFLKLISVAIIIAIPVAYHFGNQWLESYPEKIEINPMIFIGAGSLILLLAFLTVSYQSIKAALMSPVNSLKAE